MNLYGNIPWILVSVDIFVVLLYYMNLSLQKDLVDICTTLPVI